jgi:hypothetical protein
MLLKAATAALFLFPLFHAGGVPTAFQSDLRLIQMVPPESQIVAGMLGSVSSRTLPSFLVLTRNNRLDMEDFFALSGADLSRVIHQVVFVAAGGPGGILGEHSLLVSGHFDQDAMMRSVKSANGHTEMYRNLPIMVMPPLAREAGTFKEVRWLVVLNSQILIFGSPFTVHEELDRWLADSPPDALLIDRLARLGSKDDEWCLLPAPESNGVVQNLLEKLDPRLGGVSARGESVEYGIHLGAQVEIVVSSDSLHQASLDQAKNPGGKQVSGASYFLSSDDGGAGNADRVVVKVSQRKYREWLEEFSHRDLNVDGEILH